MKKVLLVLLLLGFQVGFSQQIAYIEVDKILEKMPAYEQANNEIDAQIKAWDEEIEKKFEKIEELYQAYVMNESQMTDDQKKQKQDEIIDAENQANEFKESKFGNDGELIKLQEQQLKPIYDQIYDKTEAIAAEKGFDYVFEKTTESSWIYTNPALNITADIIKALNLEQ